MTQVHFTLKQEEIKNLINESVSDNLSKNILTTVFNQLMEQERTEYINAENYERTDDRVSSRNGYYDRAYLTRVGNLELKITKG